MQILWRFYEVYSAHISEHCVYMNPFPPGKKPKTTRVIFTSFCFTKILKMNLEGHKLLFLNTAISNYIWAKAYCHTLLVLTDWRYKLFFNKAMLFKLLLILMLCSIFYCLPKAKSCGRILMYQEIFCKNIWSYVAVGQEINLVLFHRESYIDPSNCNFLRERFLSQVLAT